MPELTQVEFVDAQEVCTLQDLLQDVFTVEGIRIFNKNPQALTSFVYFDKRYKDVYSHNHHRDASIEVRMNEVSNRLRRYTSKHIIRRDKLKLLSFSASKDDFQ